MTPYPCATSKKRRLGDYPGCSKPEQYTERSIGSLQGARKSPQHTGGIEKKTRAQNSKEPKTPSSSASALKQLPIGSAGLSGAVIVGAAARSILANITSIITSASIFPPCNGVPFAASSASLEPSVASRILVGKILIATLSFPVSVPSRRLC